MWPRRGHGNTEWGLTSNIRELPIMLVLVFQPSQLFQDPFAFIAFLLVLALMNRTINIVNGLGLLRCTGSASTSRPGAGRLTMIMGQRSLAVGQPNDVFSAVEYGAAGSLVSPW